MATSLPTARTDWPWNCGLLTCSKVMREVERVVMAACVHGRARGERQVASDGRGHESPPRYTSQCDAADALRKGARTNSRPRRRRPNLTSLDQEHFGYRLESNGTAQVIVFPSESEILCEIASMNAPRALSRTMMMSRQETLARLPLPSLEDTLARYLRAATPVVTSPAQLQATRALVDEAVQERGLKLSRALTEWRLAHSSDGVRELGSRRRCS